MATVKAHDLGISVSAGFAIPHPCQALSRHVSLESKWHVPRCRCHSTRVHRHLLCHNGDMRLVLLFTLARTNLRQRARISAPPYAAGKLAVAREWQSASMFLR
ncbi:hypothetical protein QQF64_012681 [Cirrhinus molitorella]|uniref:Uncharacterized protein n=1 Tax=Cirrhinus molitorella TaxID=172907 RepID=A0ABR3LW69_9TELE